jgi:hypothetical protein
VILRSWPAPGSSYTNICARVTSSGWSMSGSTRLIRRRSRLRAAPASAVPPSRLLVRPMPILQDVTLTREALLLFVPSVRFLPFGIETAKRTPGIHCLYALAQAYRCDVRKLMGFYGLM